MGDRFNNAAESQIILRQVGPGSEFAYRGAGRVVVWHPLAKDGPRVIVPSCQLSKSDAPLPGAQRIDVSTRAGAEG